MGGPSSSIFASCCSCHYTRRKCIELPRHLVALAIALAARRLRGKGQVKVNLAEKNVSHLVTPIGMGAGGRVPALYIRVRGVEGLPVLSRARTDET